MGRQGRRKAAGFSKVIRNEEDLLSWVESVSGLKMPVRAVCRHHQAPFEYLKRAFFEPAGDLVVWAPRGGGKTRLGALATLLDLMFKPGCQVRIVGGSLEQSMKMWEHVQADVLDLIGRGEIKGAKVRERRVALSNGSVAAVLTQSERAVRGLRVQKVRCDEVEHFEPQVWEAAQLTTRSLSRAEAKVPRAGKEAEAGTPHAGPGTGSVAAAVEAISTLHSRFGMMHRIVDSARANGTPVIRWCLLDVLERCPPTRGCKGCPLWEDCGGAARRANGFFRIDDAIAMKRRVSREMWDAEMLCKRPSVKDLVFAAFDESVHVRESVLRHHPSETQVWLAMDFGYVNPFVCLFIRTDADKRVHVFDEYVQEQRMLEEHLAEIRRRHPEAVFRVACDPAGQHRSDQTSRSNVQLLRKAYEVRCRSSPIVDGVDRIRRALCPALGEPTLFVHPRCVRLIRAMLSYRYDGRSEVPVKDGVHDHLIDALRYFFVNHEAHPVKERLY